MDSKIVVLGCFDTKWEVYGELYHALVSHGEKPVMVNFGIAPSRGSFPVEIESVELAQQEGYTLEELRERNDRSFALEVMASATQKWLSEAYENGVVKAVIGMGGGGGTFLFLKAIQVLPLGLPKLCVSTLAAKDVSHLLGVKDVVLFPSVVDVAGLNRIIQPIIHQAAAAITAMSQVPKQASRSAIDRRLVAISMFGNTTDCVNACTELLHANGFEVMAFHANGVGGKNMEALIREGIFDAVMDLTTTELADEFCGGILSAGPDRGRAAVAQGLPTVFAPGCLDMVNFARPETVPAQYATRKLYYWAPDVTLMRTNEDENWRLGNHLAVLANSLGEKAAVVWPEGGFSQVGREGGAFSDPVADMACFQGLAEKVDRSVRVNSVKGSINDQAFAQTAVEELLRLMSMVKK